ncbi:MAG: oligosaccharide flippase family protein [Eubacteriales bacterium]|nr:oligosaccharide flippase family protein [Eubacteriales bacterium]MDD3882544.1 oligosaccharide flippase family protein [Eubacteriales bacterium]MDD4512844.1 oligosaccharide flippase family protein [Eubacteriales bacterium]
MKKKYGFLKSALILTAANAAVRGIGFLLRLMLSRSLGARLIGYLEMTSVVQMFLITFTTAGLPLAVSRMVARESTSKGKLEVLLSGKQAVARLSLILLPLYLALIPLLARLMGLKTLIYPLAAYAPCMLVLGFSGIYNGYCYGLGREELPALNEIAEQAIRFVCAAALLYTLSGAREGILMIIPAMAMLAGESGGLILMRFLLRREIKCGKAEKYASRLAELTSLSMPATGARLTGTLLRLASTLLTPLLLVRIGETASEAAEMVGLLHGMAMPVVFLPGIATGAIAMLVLPRAAKRTGSAARDYSSRVLAPCAALGLLCALIVYFSAPFIAVSLYNQPLLSGMLRLLAPCVLFGALLQVSGGLLAGMGRQRESLVSAIVSSALSLAGMFVFMYLMRLGINGAIYAMWVGEGVQLFMQLRALSVSPRSSQEGA